MALNTCVAERAPASTAARAGQRRHRCDRASRRCPSATTARSIDSAPGAPGPGSSSARAHRRPTSGTRSRSTTISSTSRNTPGSMAPGRARLRNGPSRCTPSNPAPPATPPEASMAAETVSTAPPAHRLQRPPWWPEAPWSRAGRESLAAVRTSSTSRVLNCAPPPPCTCTSMKPGTSQRSPVRWAPRTNRAGSRTGGVDRIITPSRTTTSPRHHTVRRDDPLAAQPHQGVADEATARPETPAAWQAAMAAPRQPASGPSAAGTTAGASAKRTSDSNLPNQRIEQGLTGAGQSTANDHQPGASSVA